MSITSPRLLAAIRAFGESRHALLEALSRRRRAVVFRKGKAYSVAVGRGGSPALVVGRVVNLKRARSPAPSPAE